MAETWAAAAQVVEISAAAKDHREPQFRFDQIERVHGKLQNIYRRDQDQAGNEGG